MKKSPSPSTLWPPHLSMDEYVVFLEAAIRNSNPVQVARQKEMEERIRTPFSFYLRDAASRK